ncbi:MAG: hypothetical protein AABZ74_18065, partial [Cyanobacteriota bacterium]
PSPSPTPVPTDTPIPTPTTSVDISPTPTPIATPTATPVPTPIPTPLEVLAFSSDRDGNRELYTMNIDGTNQQRLTFTTTLSEDFYSYQYKFSPNKDKILFTSLGTYEDITLINVDGTNRTILTNNNENNYRSVWSSDGSKIIYTGEVNGYSDIWIMNADGSNKTNLTNLQNTTDKDPSVSINNKIVFRSGRDGNNEIYIMNFDGSNPLNLTMNSIDDNTPRFSPDGTKIAFISNSNLWVMDSDGLNKRQLNFQSTSFPLWSPDGTKIAYTKIISGTNTDIEIVDVASGQINTPPNTLLKENILTWSQDSTKLIFESNNTGSNQIYSLDVVDNLERVLTSAPGNNGRAF